MNDKEYFKDKQEHDWRLKFTVDDYFEHPGYWSSEVRLPNWAEAMFDKGYKGICALDFYETLFDDDYIAEKVSGKKFIQGKYSPKILRISQKPKDKLTDSEKQKISDWESINQDGIDLENTIFSIEKEIEEYSSTGKNVGSDGQYISWTEKQKELKRLEAMRLGFKMDLKNYYKHHKKRPSFVYSKVDYIFQGKDNLWNMISYSKNTDFLVIRPVSYAGRSMKLDAARLLHAMVIEIDGLIIKNGENYGLDELIHSFERHYKPLPRPTFIVCSGSGVHLYFVFEKPVTLFTNVMEQLNEMRHWLVSQFWSSYVSEDKVQRETLTQGFRVVGSYAKDHKAIVCAFETGDKVTLEYLNSFVPEDKKVVPAYSRKGVSLTVAKELYPEWYQKVIIEKKPKSVWHFNGPWMYYWWREKMIREAKDGCRGYMMENLCALALKCQIPEDELDRDLEMLLYEMELKTEKEDNHFTEADVLRAKQTYNKKEYNAYARRVDYLRNKFAPFEIEIPENTRHKNKQHAWLQSDVVNIKNKKTGELQRRVNPCKSNREFVLREMRENGEISGRPSKQSVVQDWRRDHPNGTKYQCQKETGLSKMTVYKWWDS